MGRTIRRSGKLQLLLHYYAKLIYGQIARRWGFKVLGSCSPANHEVLATILQTKTYDVDQCLTRALWLLRRAWQHLFNVEILMPN